VDGLGGLDRRDFGVFLLDAGNVLPLDLSQAPPLDLAQAPPLLLDMAAPPPDLSNSYVHVTSVSSPSMVDLTKEGTIDWAHWGFGSSGDLDRKASGNDLISNFALINTITAMQFSDGRVGYKWNDGQGSPGQHANSMGPSTTGVYTVGIGTGASLNVPADTTPRHVRLYVGGFKSVGSVQIQLSDGSVAAYEDHSYGSVNDRFNVTYDVEYRGSGPGQVLQMSWTMLAGDSQGNVTLQSTTLLAP
jgi:hypothetical protein